MDEAQSLVADAASRIFRDLGDPQTINNAEDDSWRAPLWSALEEAGLTSAWVSDELGGAGAGIGAGFAVLRVAGEFAAPLPLAETLLAGWLLGMGGIVLPGGAMSVAPTRRGDTLTLGADGVLSGVARAVTFAAEVEHLAVLAQGSGGAVVALVTVADCACRDGRNMAGEVQNSVDFTGVTPVQWAALPDGIDAGTLLLMGAAARSMQMAGALQTVLEIAVQYAEERVAFGKPIGKFQAVQHNLARLGEEAAAAIAIANSAAFTIEHMDGWDGNGVFLDVASAKIRVGEAAGQGSAIGHQAFGAIGFTQEHILHRFVQRLWAWRDDFDNEAIWAAELGRRVAAKGGEGLWHSLTAA
ncbi:MAG: acyl-CoA dehydrogenase [Alphaproteobacteria bacterium]|nr:acyl-CoA dehydrogenase [Alphaproteobacteria bacterium]